MGTPFWCLENVSVFDHSKHGKVLVAVHNDITERKQIIEKLQKSETRYREVVEITDNLVTRVAADGKFLYVNPTAGEIFGISPDRLIGMSAFGFIHPEDTEKTTAWFYGCLKRRVSQSTIENRQVNQTTGNISHMLWTSNFLYNNKGELTDTNSIAHNITDRKKLEAEQSQQLESIAILAGWIAHDFNNLLGIITGNIDMALDDIDFDAPVKTYLENAFKASLQGRDLTNKFLIFAKGGAPAKKDTSLKELLINSTSLALSGTNISDEKLTREMVREMLVRFGCDVVLASHGEEAVSLYNSALKKNQKFDVVTIDCPIISTARATPARFPPNYRIRIKN
jgi:PAS domain S-box-containing protein